MCFNCKKFGHNASYCFLIQGNEQGVFALAAALLNRVKTRYRSLPIIEVLVDGMRAVALIDTCCTTTLLSPKLTHGYGGSIIAIKAVDGTEVKCKGKRQVKIGGKKLNA